MENSAKFNYVVLFNSMLLNVLFNCVFEHENLFADEKII